MKDKFNLAICQMNVEDNKNKNISKALSMIEIAAQNGSDIVVLPEMFNCPYQNSKFAIYAESISGGETVNAISKAARELSVYIIAGSIPEKDGDKLYNSSLIFNRNGDIIGKHRKVHLFDIDVEGKITFKESDTLAAGSEATVVETEFCKLGVAICYDMRFPELLRNMALEGARVIVVPGAFNMVTGPAHWEPLIRVRALDNQVYMAVASPARDINASYVAYGNSMIVDPWGTIVGRAGENEQIIYSQIDLALIEKIRIELPLLKHRRTDVYK
ncbi:MAG: carbon-nitrogen hydrolase family protein [Clostridia bacterium]|nr:carbon-nitrogen hydrolase family protein [Clostridia bacterium]